MVAICTYLYDTMFFWLSHGLILHKVNVQKNNNGESDRHTKNNASGIRDHSNWTNCTVIVYFNIHISLQFTKLHTYETKYLLLFGYVSIFI